MHVYTSRFRIQRQFWHFWKIALPWPLTMWPLVAACVAGFIQLQFLFTPVYSRFLPFPLNLALLLGSCVLIYKLGDRPQVHGLPLAVWLQLQLDYWFREPRTMVQELEPFDEPRRFRIGPISVWSPKGSRWTDAIR
jgi:hypothetical protein